ncbi:MAG TPA: hypothetical protein VHE55_03605 [Fimbriimonadaceae bacterium]|nr:hypothetical protein [Fimbriimonadaceae bacterium]
MPLLGVVASLALAASAIPQNPQNGGSGPKSDDSNVELLLVDVLYDHLRLDTALAALQDGHGRRFLPLRQFANALGFRLRVEPQKRVMGGFLGDPGDRLAFNGVMGRYVHKGKATNFDPGLCFERDNELYVDSDLICAFAGLHFQWRLNRLELDVSSDAPLPIRQQWIQRQRLNRVAPVQIRPLLPVVTSPYNVWSVPSIDMVWYTDANVDSKVQQSSSRLQLEGRGDLLFMSARYRYISGTGAEPASELLTLGREDPTGRMLGPMHATQFSFGDLNIPQIPLFARTQNGLGATISNFPLPGSAMSAPSIVDGRAPPRSIVEMYRGSDLLGTVRADSDGHYEFPSTPLDSGPNDLRIVVIAPNGEVQEEQRTLYGDANGPSKGQSQYRVTAAHIGSSLFPNAIKGISQDQQRMEYIGEYRLGLAGGSWLSSTAVESEGREFLGAGFHSWTAGSLWHLETMLSSNGGSAISAGISRRFGRTNFSLEHTLATPSFGLDLIPEIGSEATSITKLRVDGASGSSRHPFGYGLSVDRIDGSTPATLVRARVNGGDGHTFYANTIATRIGRDPFDASGLFQLRYPLGESFAKFDVGYGFGVERLFQTARLSIDRAISRDYRVRYGLDYDATRIAGLESVGTIYRVFGPLEFGLNFALDARGGLKANVLLSIGMEGEEALHSMMLSRPGAAQTGSVAIRAYLDRNYDGRFDQGDVLLPNIGVRIDGRAAITKTGETGRCFLDRLPSGREATVILNEDSFEDPSWAAASAGAIVIPRPGRIVRVDLGVIESAEIEGRAEGLAPNHQVLTAELIDYLGKVAHTSVLDSDGIYVFSKVRPGDYTLRIADSAGQPCGMRLVRVAPGATMKDCDLKLSIVK